MTATTRRSGKSSIPAGSQLFLLLLQGTRATPEPSPYQPRAAPPAGHQLIHADSLATHSSPPSASLSPPPCKVESPLPSSSSHHHIHFFFVPPQQPSPYIPSSVLSVPVVSSSAELPPAAPMTSFHALSPPLPPVPAASGVSSAASQPYPAHTGPSPLPAYSLAPACSVSAPSPPSVSVAPMSIATAPPAPLSSSFSDLPHRFTFDELNLPDLYASFKSLVKTMRERGGSQCE